MAAIYHQVGIKAPLENVFNAIATTEGVSHWWAPTKGNPESGGELAFMFNEHHVLALVSDYQSNKRIEWTVQGDAGEWLNTRICFNLEQLDDQVIINFQHADWQQATEFMGHCSTKWAVFLLSLKDYLETGTGKPFPHDIHINHTTFN